MNDPIPQWHWSGTRQLWELRRDPWSKGLARVKEFCEEGQGPVWRVVDKDGRPVERGSYDTLGEAQGAVKEI
jgi:hypothetical protein